jgi:hypothetical protein
MTTETGKRSLGEEVGRWKIWAVVNLHRGISLRKRTLGNGLLGIRRSGNAGMTQMRVKIHLMTEGFVSYHEIWESRDMVVRTFFGWTSPAAFGICF